MKLKLKYFWPPIIWTILLIFLSLLPGKSMPSFSIADIFAIDKVGHLFFYATLVFLWLNGFHKGGRYSLFLVSVVFLAAFLLGVMLELSQALFSSGRNFDILDVLANFFGCAVGVLIFNFFFKSK